MFNGGRSSFLYREYIKAGQTEEEKEGVKIKVVPETKEKKEQRQHLNEEEAQKAEEFKNNKDINREPIAKQPTEIKPDENTFAEEELKASSENDIKEVTESLIESDEIADVEFVFESQSRNAF